MSNRAGQLERAAFLHVTAPFGELVLSVDADGARPALGTPTIDACAVTTSTWAAGEAVSFDDAPAWSTDDCVTGTTDGDVWRFPVGSIDQGFGIALVPGPDAPIDFQVTFAP